LFGIEADPRTQNDLAAEESERAAEMAARLQRLRERVDAGQVV
jgi:hypothetical protein